MFQRNMTNLILNSRDRCQRMKPVREKLTWKDSWDAVKAGSSTNPYDPAQTSIERGCSRCIFKSNFQKKYGKGDLVSLPFCVCEKTRCKLFTVNIVKPVINNQTQVQPTRKMDTILMPNWRLFSLSEPILFLFAINRVTTISFIHTLHTLIHSHTHLRRQTPGHLSPAPTVLHGERILLWMLNTGRLLMDIIIMKSRLLEK